MTKAVPSTWQDIAARKRLLQSEAITLFRAEHASGAIQEIRSVEDVNILAEKLRKGIWTAEQVITTYALAATEAQEKVGRRSSYISPHEDPRQFAYASLHRRTA